MCKCRHARITSMVFFPKMHRQRIQNNVQTMKLRSFSECQQPCQSLFVQPEHTDQCSSKTNMSFLVCSGMKLHIFLFKQGDLRSFGCSIKRTQNLASQKPCNRLSKTVRSAVLFTRLSFSFSHHLVQEMGASSGFSRGQFFFGGSVDLGIGTRDETQTLDYVTCVSFLQRKTSGIYFCFYRTGSLKPFGPWSRCLVRVGLQRRPHIRQSNHNHCPKLPLRGKKVQCINSMSFLRTNHVH